jgi:hypothetical protein
MMPTYGKYISAKMYHPRIKVTWRCKQADRIPSKSVYILYAFGWFLHWRHVALGSVQYTHSTGCRLQRLCTLYTCTGYSQLSIPFSLLFFLFYWELKSKIGALFNSPQCRFYSILQSSTIKLTMQFLLILVQ